MNRKRIEQKITKSRRIYETVEIPKELSEIVEKSIEIGRKRKVISMKKKNYGRIAAATAAAIVLSFTAALNISETFAKAAFEIPIIGSISKVLTFRTYNTVDEDKEIHMEIPKIDETLQNESAEQLVIDVNKEIEKILEEYKQEAEQHISEYKQAFLDTGGTEEEFTQKNIKVDAGYEVKYESDEILSLVITANENWANAYGVQYFYNLDLKNGKYLTLKDLLGEEYIEKANESIKKQMKERMESDENLVYWDGSDGMEGFKTVDENTKFYINQNKNPVVVFEKYEVAPGAYGAQEFEIEKK